MSFFVPRIFCLQRGMDDFSFLELTNIRKNKEGINEPVLNYTNESSETFLNEKLRLLFFFPENPKRFGSERRVVLCQ